MESNNATIAELRAEQRVLAERYIAYSNNYNRKLRMKGADRSAVMLARNLYRRVTEQYYESIRAVSIARGTYPQ